MILLMEISEKYKSEIDIHRVPIGGILPPMGKRVNITEEIRENRGI